MNLTMPEDRITAACGAGQGRRGCLLDAYTGPRRLGEAITWDNHRWVRLRTTLAVVESCTASSPRVSRARARAATSSC